MPRKEEREKKKLSEADLQLLRNIANDNELQKKMGIQYNLSYLKTLVNNGLFSNPYGIKNLENINDVYYQGLVISAFAIIYDALPDGSNLKNYIYSLFKEIMHLREPENKTQERKPKEKPYVDVAKIHIGQVFKNYSSLCNALNIQPAKKGKAKNLQEKKLQRYFEYEKMNNSQRIIIMRIYDEPLQPNTNRAAKYSNELKALIMQQLYLNMPKDTDCTNGVVVYRITYNKLIQRLRIKNWFFFGYKIDFEEHFSNHYPKDFDFDEDIKNKDSYDYNYALFHSVLIHKLKNMIKSALTSLVKNGLVYCEGHHYIKYYENKKEYNRKMTPNEETYYNQYRLDTAIDMGYLSPDVAQFYKPKIFNRLLNKKLKKELGWYSVYYCITIRATYKNINRYICDYTNYPFEKSFAYLSLSESDMFRNKINEALNKDIRTNFAEQKEKKLDEIADGLLENEFSEETEDGYKWTKQDVIDIFRLEDDELVSRFDDSYLKMINIFSDEFILLDSDHFDDYETIQSIPEFNTVNYIEGGSLEPAKESSNIDNN